MTREEEIKQAAQAYYPKGTLHEEKAVLYDTFIENWLLCRNEMIGIYFEKDFIERFKKAMEE